MIKLQESDPNMTCNMTYPLISIVVPIYGVEAFLEQCISSLVSQTYKNLEIILVDDGSKDQCPQMCDEWSDKDSRIHVIHKKNGGLSDARNAGIREAHGDYVSFVDSDDWVSSAFIEKLYEAQVANNSDISECSVCLVDENGNSIGIRRAKAESETIDKLSALKLLVEENGIYQTVWNKLYHTKDIMDTWFEVGKYHEDEYWTYKVLDKINHITVIDEAMYFYRQRKSSIMGVGYSKKRLDGLIAKHQRAKYLQKYPELNEVCYDRLMMECLWNLQAALRDLSGDDRRYVINAISEIVEEEKAYKHKAAKNMWLLLFKTFPIFTATLRNKLKIGM